MTVQHYFRIIFYDRDGQTYNVSNIVTDDTATTARTVELQESGRQMNISTTSPVTARDAVPTPESLYPGMPPGYRLDPQLGW